MVIANAPLKEPQDNKICHSRGTVFSLLCHFNQYKETKTLTALAIITTKIAKTEIKIISEFKKLISVSKNPSNKKTNELAKKAKYSQK